MRSEDEIRRAVERTEAYPRGSYEELAGAVGALRWVLGEEDEAPPWVTDSQYAEATRLKREKE